ncbi:MAG TPA: branched-chain amino acid ABC transporter permease [Alicycliphilus sp.]|nr:branched-chain amino acid ABC transporter permease [Alicycliphilus sp.]
MLKSSKTSVVLALLALAAFALAPGVLPPDKVSAVTQMLIAALFALAFSLLVGQGGMLSFGHAAYFAIGCFGTVHAMNAAEAGVLPLPTPLMPLAGGLAALVAGAVAGFFATLRSGVYFSMVTLAIAELLYAVAPNLQGLFGGEGGLPAMRLPWAGIGFDRDIHVYYLVLGWFVVSTLAMYLYTRTSFGRLTVALRENERRVAFLGYNVHLTKLVVFAISSMFAGIAGGLLAVANENANYILFSLSNSANVVLYSFIGGTGAFFGPAVGAGLMSVLGQYLSDSTRIWLLYQGLAFVLVMMYLPSGLVPSFTDWLQRLRNSASQAGSGVLAGIVRLATIGCMLVAGVCLLELASVVFAREYQAQLIQAASWPAVAVLGLSVAPGTTWVWLAPSAVLVLGGWWLRAVSKRKEIAQ